MSEVLEKRKFKYMDGATYCMKVTGNKKQAMVLLNKAEALKGIMTDLKISGNVDQSQFVPMLDP